MTQHILCAVDLTHDQDARAMLSEAGKLAELYGAALSVITVLPDYNSSWVGTFFKEGMLKEAASKASETLHNLVRAVLPNATNVQHIVEIGTAYEKVLAAIEQTGSDLVVVGAHKPDFKDRIIGPNASRIVRHAEVSVLVVRL